MADAAVVVETNKKLSSLRQIKAAIVHLHQKEFEAAMTLAAAAEGQIPEGAIDHLFRILRRWAPQDDFNLFINWLKHSSGPDGAVISEFEVALTIARAIHKFVAIYKASCQEFEDFSQWAVAKGHIPRPLTKAAD